MNRVSGAWHGAVGCWSKTWTVRSDIRNISTEALGTKLEASGWVSEKCALVEACYNSCIIGPIILVWENAISSFPVTYCELHIKAI